ncbi:MAG: transcription elongation factor GreA [Treponema sp.]|nr:transcription elongation factor GreA [Treponema sp.]
MSNELISKVSEMLKEETWTRATISNYTKNNLAELDDIIEKAQIEGLSADIKKACDEHLVHSKDSIIALYISGILNAKDTSVDNSCLVALVDIFQKAHKEPIVEYLCEKVLAQDKNNMFALRTLADFYKQNNDERVWSCYETIIKLDLEEAEIAKALAEHYAETGDQKNEITYYKKALHRYVAAKNISLVKDIWKKLVEAIYEEIDFFYSIQRKVAKYISEDQSSLLLQELYIKYKENGKWNTCIDILKLYLSIDPKDPWGRREIADCFRNKYEGHSHLEDYIRTSGLEGNLRNVFDAINDFEKHISFDKDHFVYHGAYGIGKILKVENDTLSIIFQKAGPKKMGLKMAVDSLKPLANDHIMVKKATTKKEEFAAFVKQNKKETLAMIIKSYDNHCDLKKIKAELVPDVLSASEWTSWNSQAKKILEDDATFDVTPNDISQFMVRDREITKSEKIANEFKAEKDFFKHVDIFMKYLNDNDTDKDSEIFADMFSYFTNLLKVVTAVNEQNLAAFLVAGRTKSLFKYNCKYTFEQIYDDIDDPRVMYGKLKDTKNTSLKADFLEEIKSLPGWADEYIRLFPTVLKGEMLDYLSEKGFNDKLKKLSKDAFEDIKDYRRAVIYFFEKCQDKEWFKEAGISYEKQIIALLNIIELTFREMNSHVNTTENKKINKDATDLLFDSEALTKFMFDNGREMVDKMYTLVNDINDLDGNIKTTIRNRILEQYPDYKFPTTGEEKAAAPKGMMVTAAKLEEKKALVDQIKNVDLPKNADEVAEAREKGDLKENAEYIAAREHQRNLQHTLARLEAEIARAVIFDPTTATTAVISFATTVKLLDTTANKEVVYTILGPWESDTDKGIISYMSPVADALLNHKVDDEITFTVNDRTYNYKVLSIELAKY